MNRTNWLQGVALACAMVGCSPLITVSKDDGAGAAAGEGATPGAVVSPSSGGAPGSDPSVMNGSVGGSANGANPSGEGGARVVGNPSQGAGGFTSSPSGIAGASPSSCVCSRRGDAPMDPACPRGADTSSTTTIGPEGGTATLSTAAGPFSAQIFPGSLTDATDFTLTEMSTPPPEGFVDFSPIYELAPTGLDLPNGGGVTMFYSNSLMPSGVALDIYRADDVSGPWKKLEDTYPDAGFNMATLLRTGFFIIAYPSGETGCVPADSRPAPYDLTPCPCTRGSATPSMWCPRGANQLASATVGSDGGTVTLDGTPNTLGVPFQLTIAPDSLAEDTTVSVVELAAPPPADYTDFSPIYEVDPPGLAFAQGASIRVNEVNVADGKVNYDDLSIYTAASMDGPWTKLDDDRPNAGFHDGTIAASGLFFIGRPAIDDASCH